MHFMWHLTVEILLYRPIVTKIARAVTDGTDYWLILKVFGYRLSVNTVICVLTL
jgi:hypothetical protein